MLSSFKKSDKDGLVTPSSTPPSPLSFPANGSAPAGAPRSGLGGRLGERSIPSVIGPDLTIMGNLVSRGEVQVEGEVQGDIHGTNVVIGERARITGGIVAEEVVVRGHVMGSIRGRKVLLQSTSHVEGDVFHQTLSIEQGAYFEGKSRRSEDPTADVARPEIPDFGTRSGDGIAPYLNPTG
ncbi:MAG TPA: polymer-forming cytoskeletal protein [Hyphomicrobiaceae bacterium]|nr:polymer-forming cytoskeletal protein [Hyphomicrobiaceae bacterium]